MMPGQQAAIVASAQGWAKEGLSPALDTEHARFALSLATTADLQRHCSRPPVQAGLSALAVGMARLTPLQHTLLIWERTGEREDVVLKAVASRVRGWDVELWQAEYLVRVSLLHARWPDDRGPYEFTPLLHMPERKFWRLLREASGWIQDELTLVHQKLRAVHAGRTLTGARDLAPIRQTERRDAREVHYPARPNRTSIKSRPPLARAA